MTPFTPDQVQFIARLIEDRVNNLGGNGGIHRVGDDWVLDPAVMARPVITRRKPMPLIPRAPTDSKCWVYTDGGKFKYIPITATGDFVLTAQDDTLNSEQILECDTPTNELSVSMAFLTMGG